MTNRRGKYTVRLALALVLATIIAFIGSGYLLWRRTHLSPLLIAAIKNNDTKQVKALLARGADPDAVDEDNSPVTPWQRIQRFLAHLRNRNSEVRDQTALVLAFDYYNGPDIFLALLDHGANPNVLHTFPRSSRFGIPQQFSGSLLCDVVLEGHNDLAVAMLEHGADINSRNPWGDTPLIIAINSEVLGDTDKAFVKILIDRKSDINATDQSGDSALLRAVRLNRAKIIPLLLDKHADVNAKDKDGRTPLMWAAQTGDLDAVKAIVAKGADPNAKNRFGMTPLKLAESEGHEEIVEFLRRSGADD